MNDKMNLHDSQNISEDTSLTAGEDTLSGDTNPVENNNKGSDSQQQILLAKAASSRADNNTVYRPPVRSNAVKKGKKKTKNRWVRPLIWISTVVLVSVLMAGTVIIAGMDFLGIGTSGSFEINVEKGATLLFFRPHELFHSHRCF